MQKSAAFWMPNLAWRLLKDEGGQDLIEYGLLLGIVTTSMIVLGPIIQGRMSNAFTGWTNNRNNLWVPNAPTP